LEKRRYKFLILILSRIKKQKGPLVGMAMVVGDAIIQNGGFLTVHYTTYHFNQIKSLAVRAGKFCMRIQRRTKSKRRK